ncbi:hypothetical protein PRVXT_002425 [Proteinivorax tanatarense]|uniref:ABC transporter permease n=1 Tax=Proteinivorax tanatarense TaxID=1260629 RepID=A0AAU7VKA6_9FIRM
MSRKLSLAWYLYKKQMIWVLWFIGVMFIIQATIFFFNPYDTSNNINFLENIFGAACIFMLITGLLTSQVYFKHFIKNGITRKEYFISSTIAAVDLSLSIVLLSTVITIFFKIVSQLTGFTATISSLSFLETSSFWIAHIFSLSLIIMCYYVGGWAVGIGIIKLNKIKRNLFIAFNFLFLSFVNLLWKSRLEFTVINFNINFPNLTLLGSIFATMFLISVVLYWMRKLIK